MKSILFLTNLLPYPGKSGGTQTTLKKLDNFIKEGFEVSFVFMKTKDTSEELFSEFISLYSDTCHIFYEINDNNVRSVASFAKSFLEGIPLNIYRNRCASLTATVNNLIDENNFDIIFCDHLEMFQYVPSNVYSKTIMLEHNAEYMIWRRYANQVKNPILKIGIFLESCRMKKYELKACKEVRFVIIAPSDKKYVSKKNEDKFIDTYHPANDFMLQLPLPKINNDGLSLLFIGTMSWVANYQGVFWFIEKVLPHIVEKVPNAIFHVIGKFKGELPKLDNQNVILHGFVDDIEPYYKSSNIFVCPLLFGSGIKIKVLDAMYRGLPLVTTTVGAENLSLINGEHCFIEDDPKKMAEKILELYKNKGLAMLFANNSRELAKQKYTWDEENKKVMNMIEIIGKEHSK